MILKNRSRFIHVPSKNDIKIQNNKAHFHHVEPYLPGTPNSKHLQQSQSHKVHELFEIFFDSFLDVNSIRQSTVKNEFTIRPFTITNTNVLFLSMYYIVIALDLWNFFIFFFFFFSSSFFALLAFAL